MPQKAGFSAFLSHGKFKLLIEKVMEKSMNFIAQFLLQQHNRNIYFGCRTMKELKFKCKGNQQAEPEKK